MNNTIVPFDKIDIDRKEIEQKLLDLTGKTRSNIFNWQGQFSPQFVEVLIGHYCIDGDIILDPFSGSGTTLAECARKDIEAYGVELNISAFYMSKFFEISNLAEYQRKKVIDNISQQLRSINELCLIKSKLVNLINESDDSIEKNILSLLVVLLNIDDKSISIELLTKKWSNLKKNIILLPYCEKQISASRGDARKIGLPDNKISVLITSPPYINVFNYHQKYRGSVETLGFDVLDIAKSEIGSNRKFRSNRFYTVIQYCIDMALVFQEAIRVCKDKSRMIFIVGRESSVLNISFCNSEIVYLIARKVFDLDCILRQDRTFINRYGKAIVEDILHFENKKKKLKSEEEIVREARLIGLKLLEEKLNHCDLITRDLMEIVIANSDKVIPSELK